MDNKFTIRLKPFNGESLSGYLMRVALANGVELNNILKYTKYRTKRTPLIYHFPQQIDINSLINKNINFETLSNLLVIEKGTLENMTLFSLFNKFSDNIDSKSTIKYGLTQNTYVNNKRRYCPLCMKEYRNYKLIWQVAEIEICDIHLIRLTSECSACQTEQPYIAHNLELFKCTKCSTDLDKRSYEYISDKNFIVEQLRKYKFWHYLLNPNVQLCKQIKQFCKEKSLAITFLYACQLGQSEFDINFTRKYFNNGLGYYLLRLVHDGLRPMYVTIKRLSNLLKKIDINIEEFSQINVPNEFIQSLMLYYSNKNLVSGSCCFNLCTSYGTNSKMKKLNHLDFQRKNYSSVYICTGCHMKYGYTKDKSEWEIIKANTNYINVIEQVLPLINMKMERGEIVKKTGLNYRNVSKAIGYIASHELASYEMISKFVPELKQQNIVSCFEKILKESGGMGVNAKRLFNWSINDFSYFLTSPEVQEYIAFNSYKNKRRIYKSDMELEKIVRNEINNSIMNSADIKFIHIAKNIKISNQSLYRNGIVNIYHEGKKKKECEEYKEIINKINNFINLKANLWERVYCKDIYKFIGKDYRWIKANHPELFELVNKKVKQYNELRKINLESQYIGKVKVAVKQLFILGITITYKNIAKEVNLPEYIIRYNENIKKAIAETKSSL